MADQKDVDATMEDDYDEEADSDFDVENGCSEISSSPSEEDDKQAPTVRRSRGRPQRQRERKEGSRPEPLGLDSGDEATIRERDRTKRKQKQKGEDDQDENSDVEEQGWRARTRAMREKDQLEKRKSKLASIKGSTIDVDQLWEAMNKPGGLDGLPQPTAPAAPVLDSDSGLLAEHKENIQSSHAQAAGSASGRARQNRMSQDGLNEMITIDETYEFAGEVHTRKMTVPRSSAEATQWLAQRSVQNMDPRFPGNEPVRRPLRKVSRFDPNLNNMDLFKKSWARSLADGKETKVQKLNTVEKSKMDWAAHVDQEGLQDELTEHAKAKGGYLGRMDFLGQVEQRKEEEARRMRVKG